MGQIQSILSKYKEGSRTGNISILKEKKDKYNIYVNWDDPRYKRILLFSGKLKQCINFSEHRFGIKKQLFNSFQF
jgi:hypothetical protein